jgi:hypothetical protein
MKWIFTISVSFISFLALAQNYSGQYPGAIHFYSVNGSNQLTSIREDSSSINGNVLTRFPELLMRDVMNENIVDTNCMFWGAPECLYKKDAPTLLGNRIVNNDNSIKYFNFFGDSLSVDFSVSIGNTQTVYKDSDTNLLVKYFCLKKDTTTIFGVADSVILFTIITTDSLSNLLTSALSGDTIIYSKNTGLLKGFSIDNFPDSYSLIELKGIRNPNYGFYGLTYADIYDYQIGDMFEMNHYGAGGFYKKLYTVLNRTDNVNDVSYTFNIISATAIDYPPTIYVYDTINSNESYSKIVFIEQSITEGYYELNSNYISGCGQATAYNYDYWDWCEPYYCPTADCFGSSDCFGSYQYAGKLVKMRGKTYERTDLWGFGQQSIYGMGYFNINGTECGSSFVL